jgi:hypothetical protein
MLSVIVRGNADDSTVEVEADALIHRALRVRPQNDRYLD